MFAALAACRTADQQRASADKAVYSILEARRAEIATEKHPFTIDPPPDSLRQRVLDGAPVGTLDLVQSLEIAAENSRTYQARKESLYLVALDLTLERFAFEMHNSGELSALLQGDGDGAQTASTSADFGLTKLLGSGAMIIGDIGLSLARTLTSSDGWDATSNASLAVTQPLLRGFGARIVREPLTQAERNVVYEVRTFERFRRTFAVEVVNRYFRILQQTDVLGNEERNYESLKLVRAKNDELAKAGRKSQIEVDQAMQDELRAKNSVILQHQRLDGLYDDFKLFLGLPVECTLALDQHALDNLAGEDIPPPTEDQVVDIALQERLDYLTVLDRVDDSARKVDVAADDLRAGLDVAASVNATSNPGKPLVYDSSNVNWQLGLVLDLPFDRLRERNAYRAALINLQADKRTAEEQADTIRSDLRDTLRTAETTLESLAIQRNAVTLAERRVESTSLNLDAGRSDTRDLLDAQQSLVQAQNAAVAARVDYYLARLALFRDIEALRVDENGLHVIPDAPSAPEEHPLENPPEQQP